MRIGRRSGISTLIGAIFFVIIVVLVVGSLSLLFNTFNTSVNGIHENDAAQEASLASMIRVQNATFGGMAFSAAGTVAGAPNIAQTPILPISNMNFSEGMAGWYVSRGFSTVTDSATATESPQAFTYAGLPATETFTLTVHNTDAPPSGFDIVNVEVLADQQLAVPAIQPLTLGWDSNNPPVPIGNNITWTALFPNSIGAGGSASFSWYGTVPAAYGTYYNTVVISWAKNGDTMPYTYSDTAITTVNATVVVSAAGSPPSSTGTIIPTPPGATPGGLTAGYDADATTTSSESGPGSLYIEYQPTYNGNPLQTGQQLLSTVSFTSPFILDASTVSSLQLVNCCTVSWASSIDSLSAYRNSLVYYHVYIINPAGVAWNVDELNPTILNTFGTTGWVFRHTPIAGAPPAGWINATSGFWYTGTYELVLSVESILPGASLGHAGYPTALTEHFDDIGLALKPKTTTYYGSTKFRIYTGLNASEVQGMEVLVNMSGATANTTAYGFLTDNSRFTYNPQLLVQFGTVTFNSAAGMDSVIPLPNAAYYVNGTADVLGCTAAPRTCGYVNIVVNASSAFPFTLQASVEAVIRTYNKSDVVVTFTNEGESPLHLVSLYLTGPNGVAVFSNGDSPNGFNYWVDGGSRVFTSVNLAYPGSALPNWLPGQQYTVTVTTDTGLVFSRTFTAPIA